MTKYIHCVFIRHTGSGKTFLFHVARESQLQNGAQVLCETKYGESEGICVGKSFIVSESALESIVAGVGAYFPLKSVVGTVETELVRETKVKRFDKLPF